MPSVFIPHPDGTFLPTDISRSAWGDALVHGGPPAGLLAYAISRDFDAPGWRVARLTVDLFRQVPVQPLRVVTRSVREGRRIHAVEASLFAGETEVTRATAILLKESDPPVSLPASFSDEGEEIPPPDRLTIAPLAGAGHTRFVGYHTTVEVAWTSGDTDARTGARAAWMRFPHPLIEGETTSPLTHLASLSDFGNALGGFETENGWGFINVDITMYLNRMPVGAWFHLSSVARPASTGHGVITTALHDERGYLGQVVQATLANPRT